MGTRNISSVSVGPIHACAIQNHVDDRITNTSSTNVNVDAFNKYFCWGINNFGSLDIDDLHSWVIYKLGFGQTCGLYQDKNSDSLNLKCYGYYAMNTKEFRPFDIPIDYQSDVNYIATGFNHLLIQKNQLRCFGSNEHGQCDIRAPKYSLNSKKYLKHQIQASAGRDHTCILIMYDKGSNNIECFGNNDNNQSTNPPISYFRPVQYSIISGFQHNCAEIIDGLNCWGNNSVNQAEGVIRLVPRLLENRELTMWQNLQAVRIKKVAAGGQHNCYVLGDGEAVNKNDLVACWGSNNQGESVYPFPH